MIKAPHQRQLEVEVPEGTSILDAARSVQVKIPTLCKHKDLLPTAACGICIVRNGAAANSARLLHRRRGRHGDPHPRPRHHRGPPHHLELILSNHPQACLTCGRNGKCELQTLAADFNIRWSRSSAT
jgi:NADH dehydrogenase/NADH:ubiquinone oxidoreductase subunit G